MSTNSNRKRNYRKKSLSVIFSTIFIVSQFVFVIPSSANDCNVGQVPTSFSYLNPPEDPTKVTPGTVLLGQLQARVDSPNFGIFRVESNLKDVNSITTYFFFYSSDGGKSWSCQRSYSSFTTIDLVPDTDYVGIVVASSQGGKGISTVSKFSTKKRNEVVCAPADTRITAQYVDLVRKFELRAISGKDLKSLPNGFRFRVEVSIDGWKTKGIYRDFLTFGLAMFANPLSETQKHEFRITPDLEQANRSGLKPQLINQYLSTDCASFSTFAFAKDTRSECEKNPLLDKCSIVIVPGENAGSEPTIVSSPSALPASKPKTILCVKGKLTKKVTGVNPRCPSGYKKK